MDTNDRRTGKTQKMLEAVLVHCLEGKGDVQVVTHNTQYAKDLMRRFRGMVEERGLHCSLFRRHLNILMVHDKLVEFLGVDIANRPEKTKGRHKDFRRFTDHYVWEESLADRRHRDVSKWWNSRIKPTKGAGNV